jgi:hypothetical protein
MILPGFQNPPTCDNHFPVFGGAAFTDTTVNGGLRMLWVTRSHIHVDRVACPWLITRFIDSNAEFLFVPKGEVMGVAEREAAIPFDTPGAVLNHEGDMCTFDVIIRNYGLTDPALLRMAKIVRAADTERPELDALAAGLEAIAVGFSLRYPDDIQNLERQFEVYDSLYAWCRLETAKGKRLN